MAKGGAALAVLAVVGLCSAVEAQDVVVELSDPSSVMESDIGPLSQTLSAVFQTFAQYNAPLSHLAVGFGPEFSLEGAQGDFALQIPKINSVVEVLSPQEVEQAVLEVLGTAAKKAKVALGLTLVSIGVSFIPIVGDCYDAVCLASGRDLITQEQFTKTQMILGAAGLAAGIGSAVLFAKLAKPKIVVLTQKLMDPEGATKLTEEGLKAVAKQWKGKIRFKFVQLGELAPEQAALLIRKELKKGRTVVVNAHGFMDEVYTGATKEAALHNDDIVRLVGQDLGGQLYDASCFSAHRRMAWEKVVGAKGKVVTLSEELTVDLVPGAMEVVPQLARKSLPRIYNFYLDGFWMHSYLYGPGLRP